MIEDSIWGVTNQVKEQASTLGRMITLLADWGWEIPGCSIDRMCASSLTAIGVAAAAIAARMADCLKCGGWPQPWPGWIPGSWAPHRFQPREKC